MNTTYNTGLPDGFYIAPAGQRPRNRNTEGGYADFAEFKHFLNSEVGMPEKFHAWFVCNGVAHVLSCTVKYLQDTAK